MILLPNPMVLIASSCASTPTAFTAALDIIVSVLLRPSSMVFGPVPGYLLPSLEFAVVVVVTVAGFGPPIVIVLPSPTLSVVRSCPLAVVGDVFPTVNVTPFVALSASTWVLGGGSAGGPLFIGKSQFPVRGQ